MDNKAVVLGILLGLLGLSCPAIARLSSGGMERSSVVLPATNAHSPIEIVTAAEADLPLNGSVYSDGRRAYARAAGVQPGASQSKITAAGCVEAGVEGGCLILRDSKTQTLYNLFFGEGKKPGLNTAIEFTATAHDGPTICQQGQPLDVTKWTPLKTKCPSQEPGSLKAEL
jgi:hypothetical protein